MKSINQKAVNFDIDHGYTVMDLCKKYECNSEDELLEALRKVFPIERAFNMIQRKLRANGKLPRRNKSGRDESGDPKELKAQQKKEPAPKAQQKKELAPKAQQTAPQKEAETSSPTLDELITSETQMSAEVIELEKRCVDLNEERLSNRKQFAEIIEDIKHLKETCEAKVREAQAIVAKDQEVSENLAELGCTLQTRRGELEDIRRRIEYLSKIEICVYSDRRIAPFDEASKIDLDDSGHEERYERLSKRPEAEDYRPRDLRVVARILSIVDNLGGRPVELIFEDEEVKQAYGVFQTL